MKADEHVVEIGGIGRHVVDVLVVDGGGLERVDEALRLNEVFAAVGRNPESVGASAHTVAGVEMIRIVGIDSDVKRHVEVIGRALVERA